MKILSEINPPLKPQIIVLVILVGKDQTVRSVFKILVAKMDIVKRLLNANVTPVGLDHNVKEVTMYVHINRDHVRIRQQLPKQMVG